MRRRIGISIVVSAVLFLCAHGPASAMAEFCPATLKYQAVGQSEGNTAPAAIYGFELTALGPRTITSATLAFDTSAGWFTVDVPAVTLIEKNRHYSGQLSSFSVHDFVSPVLYIRFPQALTIAHAWVDYASAENSAPFPWDGQGRLKCDPSPQNVHIISLANTPRIAKPGHPVYVVDSKDVDNLSTSPIEKSLVIDAQSSKPLYSSACTEPFSRAAVAEQYVAAFPPSMYGLSGMTTIQIAIDANGKLMDAWVWSSSGYVAFDNASLKAAVHSKYSAARAYCMHVPSEYFFRVEFDPHS